MNNDSYRRLAADEIHFSSSGTALMNHDRKPSYAYVRHFKMASWQPPKDFSSRPVTVLGGGVLGRRIAACWYAAGYHVIIRDPSEKARSDALNYIQSSLGAYKALTDKTAGTITTTEDFNDSVKQSWLVFEVVPEKLEIKLSTFAELEKHAPSDCILASNSSSFKSGDLVTRLKDATKKRVLNTHYMMPPEALIVELMTDGETEPALIDFVFKTHKEVGLHPIVALKPSSGFIMNRIWAAIKRETLAVLAEGVSTAPEIDRVFKELYGARDGPCHMMDLVGLDTVENIEAHYVQERHLDRSHLDWLHDKYIVPGKLGKKSANGGLYDKPEVGSQTVLYFLNLGVGEKLSSTDPASIMHQGQILSLNVQEGGKPTELVSKIYMPDGIAISESTKRIYWTDMGNPGENDGSVWSSGLDGSDVKAVLESGKVHTPKQCVIDETSQKLYFCDREGLRVMRVNLDGTELETLIKTGDWETEKEFAKDQRNWCVGIAVSPKYGKFYWTQKGASKSSQGRIFSASMDLPHGAKVTDRSLIEVVAENLPEPIDLELNDDETVLFWSDRGELPLGNTLNKKTVVGKAPVAEATLGRQILAQGLGEGIGLRYDSKYNVIYVADMAGRIWKCSPDKLSMKEKVFEGPSSALTGLTLLHV